MFGFRFGESRLLCDGGYEFGFFEVHWCFGVALGGGFLLGGFGGGGLLFGGVHCCGGAGCMTTAVVDVHVAGSLEFEWGNR